MGRSFSFPLYVPFWPPSPLVTMSPTSWSRSPAAQGSPGDPPYGTCSPNLCMLCTDRFWFSGSGWAWGPDCWPVTRRCQCRRLRRLDLTEYQGPEGCIIIFISEGLSLAMRTLHPLCLVAQNSQSWDMERASWVHACETIAFNYFDFFPPTTMQAMDLSFVTAAVAGKLMRRTTLLEGFFPLHRRSGFKPHLHIQWCINLEKLISLSPNFCACTMGTYIHYDVLQG